MARPSWSPVFSGSCRLARQAGSARPTRRLVTLTGEPTEETPHGGVCVSGTCARVQLIGECSICTPPVPGPPLGEPGRIHLGETGRPVLCRLTKAVIRFFVGCSNRSVALAASVRTLGPPPGGQPQQASCLRWSRPRPLALIRRCRECHESRPRSTWVRPPGFWLPARNVLFGASFATQAF